MTGRRGFAEWKGQPVMVSFPGGNIHRDYGVLEEVNEWGLVLRSNQRIVWRTEAGEFTGHDVRQVPEFRPWQMISSVRMLEPEERKDRGF